MFYSNLFKTFNSYYVKYQIEILKKIYTQMEFCKDLMTWTATMLIIITQTGASRMFSENFANAKLETA